MRKVIFGMAVSLDGFIEGAEGGTEWLSDAREFEFARAFVSRFDTAFYGRVAYEQCGLPRSVAASVSDAEREYNDAVNKMRKYVFSRRLRHVPGKGMMINGNMIPEVNRLRDEEGKDIWFCGGADILRTFIELDLIDEYVFAVQPVALGRGKPLFGELREKLDLELLGATCLKSGVVMLHYKKAKR